MKEWIEKPGAGLTKDDLLSAAAVVFEGKAVQGTVEQISGRLAKAHWVTLLREPATGRIIGVAALKSPDPDYRHTTFENAEVSIDGYEKAPELGYVAVAADMRRKGHSVRLVQRIINEMRQPLYATTDDEWMKRNLRRAGFSQVGSEWQGNRGTLSLWTVKPPL